MFLQLFWQKWMQLKRQIEMQGFPTIGILRNGGKNVQEYNGPRGADSIVDYLKKQVGPASAEIKSLEDIYRHQYHIFYMAESVLSPTAYIFHFMRSLYAVTPK